MDKILISISVLSIGEEYDLFIPINATLIFFIKNTPGLIIAHP